MKQKHKHQRQEDFKTHFEEKVLYINRCSTVVKGGRKFSFSALIVTGDGHGHIGFGFAKANEVSDAIRKGGEAARKNIVTFELEGLTIPHDVMVTQDGSTVFLKPAPNGTGIIAGSKVRSVLEIGGVKDVFAKIYGSSNPINQVRAIFKALLSLRNRQDVLKARGLS